MRMLLAVMLLVLGFGCSKEDVSAAKEKVKAVVVEKVPPLVAAELECANTAAIAEDVKAALDKVLGAEQESVGGVLCTAAVNALVPVLVQNAIPAKWECKATDAKDKLTTLASKACAGLQG